MSTSYQRGIILFQQGRYDLAGEEFRRELSQDPDNPYAHAFLALCLSGRNGDDGAGEDALREADEAVRLGPDEPFIHFARGHVLHAKGRLDAAEASVNESIALNPDQADAFALLANIAVSRSRWAEALAAADQGLALEPDNTSCANFRALALVQLGRKTEAASTLGSALADDPENPLTHANQGWAMLHRGDHAGALVHFREALRLDPEMEWARVGIVEALKARFLIYRLILGFFLWMGRQGQVAQWAVILGIVFGRRLLSHIAHENPKLAPVLIPILYLSFAFLLLTWVASPLFNLFLRLNKFGRMVLSRDQRIESNWVGGCVLLATASLVVGLLTRSPLAIFGTGYFGFLLLPLSVTFQQGPGRPRWIAASYTAVLAAMGLPVLSLILLGTASPFARHVDRALESFQYFIFGAILSSWVAAFLGLRSRAS